MDHTHDKNHSEFFKLTHELDLPEFVKEACLLQDDGRSALRATQFADQHMRLFPIHTEADTYVSAAFLQKKAAEGHDFRPDVVERLQDACHLFDISWDSACPKTMVKEASAPLLTIEYLYQGVCHHRAVVGNSDDLQKVATDVIGNRANYVYETRRDVASQVLDSMDKLACVLEPEMYFELEKMAGRGVGTLYNCQTAISQRLAGTRNILPALVDQLTILDKVACETAQQGILPPVFLDKVACILDIVDRKCELRHRYTDSLEKTASCFTFPENQLYTTTVSQYDGYSTELVKLANGRSMLSSSINYRNVTDFLADTFGKEASQTARQAMEELSSPQADMLCRYLDKKAADGEDEGDVVVGGAPISAGLNEDDLTDKKDGDIDLEPEKDEKSAIEGEDNWVSDDSQPRLPVNEDSTGRKA